MTEYYTVVPRPPEIAMEHPFQLVEEARNTIVLHAVQTGETLTKVRSHVGHALLALGCGMAQEQTNQELINRIDPEGRKDINSNSMMKAVRGRAMHRAPDIISYARTANIATFYYQDTPPPEARDRDFAHWADQGTHIRYDPSTDYVVLGHNGQRKGARVVGPVQKAIWQYLLENPGLPLSNRFLGDKITPDKTWSIPERMQDIRSFISRYLGVSGFELMCQGVRDNVQTTMLCADTIEIVDTHNELASGESHEKSRSVSTEDVAIIAHGWLANRLRIRDLSRRVPALEWPNTQTLLSLSGLAHSDETGERSLDIDRVVRSLEKVRQLSESDLSKQQLPPAATALIGFLRRLDGVTFSIRDRQTKGLDVFERIMWANH